MIKRWIPLFALAAALGVAGCGLQKGSTVMTAGPGLAQPAMQTAPEDGNYAVYTSMSPNPTGTVMLHKGDQLGFRKGDNGHIVAVGGDQTFDLGMLTAQAYWKYLGSNP